LSQTLVSLGQLAYACRLYEAMTDFCSSLARFQSSVDGSPDLSRQDHRRALLKWLNSWGCRNLALSCHEQVSEALAVWNSSARDQLPDSRARLTNMTDERLVEFEELFNSLAHLPAREGRRNGRTFTISFGPTATSKTLFALRPEVFVPWDELIRRETVPDESGASYVMFLKLVRRDLQALSRQGAEHEITLEDLPRVFGRSAATPAQLVGEFYWISITRKVEPPGPETLRKWLAWS